MTTSYQPTRKESRLKHLEDMLTKHQVINNSEVGYIPQSLCKDFLDKLNTRTNILVMFNIELAITMIEDYDIPASEITVFTNESEGLRTKLARGIGCKTIEGLNTTMKFNTTILNPPYNGLSALHQKFFNKAVELTKDGGSVISIQPATAYISKKSNQNQATLEMQNNIRKYKTDVRMVPGTVFEGASIINTLSITHLTKTESDVIKLEYINGNVYDNIKLENINDSEMDPEIYSSLTNKLSDYIAKNGSIQNIIYRNKTIEKNVYRIAVIRGHIGSKGKKDDFYTTVMKDKNSHKITPAFFGLEIKPGQEDNTHSYLSTFISRFALSVYKKDGHLEGGEMKMIPLVDLNRIWTDADLCKKFGITTEEYAEILKVIPAYY